MDVACALLVDGRLGAVTVGLHDFGDILISQLYDRRRMPEVIIACLIHHRLVAHPPLEELQLRGLQRGFAAALLYSREVRIPLLQQ